MYICCCWFGGQCRLKPGTQQALWSGTDAYAFNGGDSLTAHWVGDDALEAWLEQAADLGYYQQRYRDDWPDCKGWCMYGRCTVFAVRPGCCWAGPPRAEDVVYVGQAADQHGDSLSGEAAASAFPQHHADYGRRYRDGQYGGDRRHDGYHHDGYRHGPDGPERNQERFHDYVKYSDKPWLCWS